MAALANLEARRRNAISLSFINDSRWVNGEVLAKHYGLELNAKDPKNFEKFHREYHRILAEHGGEVKNLPRQLWNEAIVVFTNGPDFPLTVKMAPYIEGENDTVQWTDDKVHRGDQFKSDLLTDWWK
jgi:hypothetical protein